MWCSVNSRRTKEMVVDWRANRAAHVPLQVNGICVGRVSLRFPAVHVSDDLAWHTHTMAEAALVKDSKAASSGGKPGANFLQFHCGDCADILHHSALLVAQIKTLQGVIKAQQSDRPPPALAGGRCRTSGPEQGKRILPNPSQPGLSLSGKALTSLETLFSPELSGF